MLEVEREACAQVKRDQIAFEGLTGLLQRLLIFRTDSEDIVSRTECLKSMVLRRIR